MNDIEAKLEIEKLTKKLNECNIKYFNKGDSELSDYEYDCLLDELIKLEEQYPEFKLENSPTNNLGDINVEGFKKIEHKIPMLSLKKTYSFEDLDSFIKNVENTFQNPTFICELKLDGISIDAHYVNNSLISISTRGDGNTGDDITQNKHYIKNLPEKISSNYKDIHLRGEVIMKFKDFNNANKNTTGELLSNPRNTVSGTLKSLKNNNNLESRILTVFFYNITFENNEQNNIKTQFETLNTLKSFNAPICDIFKLCKNTDDIHSYITHFNTEKDNLEFPIDGIVIKVNELEYANKLGFTNKNPKGAIAFKYKPNAISTKLINVEFTVGRSGIITPIANFEPINLNGTIVKRATLHNENEINNLDIREGDYILVKKSGEIIPKIIGADITKRDINKKKIEFITHCPSCNNILVKKNDLYYCTNRNCKGIIIETLKHFVSKKALNIKSIGDKVISTLVEKGLLSNISDIYKLKYRDLVRIQGFSTLSSVKIIEEINKSKEAPFYKLLYGLGIDGVGEVVAKNIVESLKNIENIRSCKIEDLTNIKLVGHEIAKNIINYFNDEENMKLITELKNHGLNFKI